MPKPFQVRERAYKPTLLCGETYRFEGDKRIVVRPSGEQKESWKGTQVTGSEGHSYLPKQGRFEGGGPFYTVKMINHPGVTNYHLGPSSNSRYYDGPMYTPFKALTNVSRKTAEGHLPNSSDLDIAGTKAIAACAPLNPAASLSTGLAEALREGLPSLPGIQAWEKKASILKSVGSEFLNYEFGIAPLVREVKEVSSSIRERAKLMEQLAIDSGKDIRRSYAFPISKTYSETSYAAEYPEEPGVLQSTWHVTGGTAPVLTAITTTVKRVWFSGCFRYALPSTSSSWSRMMRTKEQAEQLLGTDPISPEVLWALTPWSWAVDWFSDASDVLHNLTLFKEDGLVMLYGYIMEHNSVKTVYTLNKSGLVGSPPPPPPSYTLVESKVRRPANPFGFGLSWEDLSPSQIAIAAAVGVSLL